MRLTIVVNENVPHGKYSTMKAVQARIIGLKMAWEYLLESGNVSLAVAAASVRSLNPSTPLPLKTSAMFHVGSPLASRPAKCGVCDPACILGWHGLWQYTKFIHMCMLVIFSHVIPTLKVEQPLIGRTNGLLTLLMRFLETVLLLSLSRFFKHDPKLLLAIIAVSPGKCVRWLEPANQDLENR